MRSISLLALVLAAASPLVAGSPLESGAVTFEAEPSMQDDIVEHVVHKRGDVLSPRDLQQAEELGVGIEQSTSIPILPPQPLTDPSGHLVFKHSILKRSSGEDISIWVHNSWQEERREEAPPQSEKRALHIC